jgi:hypothetical protein
MRILMFSDYKRFGAKVKKVYRIVRKHGQGAIV